MTPPFDIWLVWADAAREPELVARYRALLSDEERARAGRFHFDRDRHLYTVAHALVRTRLSHYEPDVAPTAWRFEVNRYGRPEVTRGDLRFNLSHTRGLVACAVTRGREIGVDVENVGRVGQTVAIADRLFAEHEVRALRALPEAEQRERFFTYWTLKESYIKARGMGLSLPLAHFAFEVGDTASIEIAFDAALDDDPARWRFGVVRPGPEHALAYAIERRGDDPQPHIEAIVPLLGSG